jgi:hypothetical protein
MVAGVAWTGAAKWTVQALSWIGTIIVVRRRHPTDDEIVVMATAFIAVPQPICDFGIGLHDRAGTRAAAFVGELALKAAVPAMSPPFFIGSAYPAALFAFHHERLRRAWSFVRQRDGATGAPTLDPASRRSRARPDQHRSTARYCTGISDGASYAIAPLDERSRTLKSGPCPVSVTNCTPLRKIIGEPGTPSSGVKAPWVPGR